MEFAASAARLFDIVVKEGIRGRRLVRCTGRTGRCLGLGGDNLSVYLCISVYSLEWAFGLAFGLDLKFI